MRGICEVEFMREGDAALPAGKHVGGALLDKHFLRKHGAKATCGQRS